MDNDRRSEQEIGYGIVQSPSAVEVDVDAEHDQDVSRRASMTDLHRLQQQYTSRGAIPPVQHGFATPGPTASELAFGPGTQAVGPAAIQAAQATQATQGTQGSRYNGPLCERPGAHGTCQLTPTERHARVDDLNRRAGFAATAFHAAVQNARIDELLKKAPQLGLVGELLIGLLGTVTTGLLGVAIGRAITVLNTRGMTSPLEIGGVGPQVKA